MRTHQQVFLHPESFFHRRPDGLPALKTLRFQNEKISEISNEIKVLTTRQAMTSA